MAQLGFRTIDELVGHVECIVPKKDVAHPKAKLLDFSALLAAPAAGQTLHCTDKQDHGISKVLDRTLIERAWATLDRRESTIIHVGISNSDRTFGAMLGGEISRRFGQKGLPEDTVRIHVTGTAGQSFGAFAVNGMTIDLEGDANDYVGKGLSGGRVVVRPALDATFRAEDNVIAGNTLLYGATSGSLFVRGRVGERFCVRNSGATAVVEGVGDHACEYMTGGRVAILGPTGRNVAAGMSGGVAYLLDLDETLVNTEMVDLEPLDEGDVETLRRMLTEHATETGSPVAQALLDAPDWSRFTKVMPRDYKKVLLAMEQARQDGTDVDEAVMAASKG
jgi:glutamate synthase (NADPH/NADH) large chain